MKILLKRVAKKDTYTIGHLYVDGKYVCDSIEDKDRGLNDKMSIQEITSKKIYGITAIPTGTYQVVMNIKSTKYSNFTKYPWAKQFNGMIPRVMDVKGFDGILIHPGNTANDSLGCILVGENKKVGQVINSQKTWLKLMQVLKSAKDEIFLTIE